MNNLLLDLCWCVVQATLCSACGAIVYLAVRSRSTDVAKASIVASLGWVLVLTTAASVSLPSWFGVATHVPSRASASTPSSVRIPALAAADQIAGPAPIVPRNVPSLESPLLTSGYWGNLWSQMRSVRNATTEEVDASPEGRGGSLMLWAFGLGAALGTARLVVAWSAMISLSRFARPVPDDDVARLKTLSGPQPPLRRSIRWRESSQIQTAVACGWFRPTILLPVDWRDWPSDELAAMLAHEVAHIAACDFGATLTSQLAVATHFYHPLVHWLASRLRLEQELAADAWAAKAVGGNQIYAKRLAAIVLRADEQRTPWGVSPFISTQSPLLRRIAMLQRIEKKAPNGNQSSRLVAYAVLAVAAVSAAGLRVPASPGTRVVAAEPTSPAVDALAAPEYRRTPYDFKYVPDDAALFIALRPAWCAANPSLRPWAELLQDISRPSLPSDQLEQATLAVCLPQLVDGIMTPGTGGECTIIRMRGGYDFRPPLAESYGKLKPVQHAGRELLTWRDSPTVIAFHSPEESTLVSRARVGLESMLDI
ncbi:MAG: M56 family metallopeptidase, partial [Planctomycetales bacterium]|nr:M56 family metallopeptidase [Planctomycetales bacterium]